MIVEMEEVEEIPHVYVVYKLQDRDEEVHSGHFTKQGAERVASELNAMPHPEYYRFRAFVDTLEITD